MKHWSEAIQCYSILLINHSIHVHSSLQPQCRVEFSLISPIYCSVFTFTRCPSASLNHYDLVLPLQLNACHMVFLHTKWVILMLMRLRSKVHISFVHMTTGWKFASSLKKIKFKKSEWSSIHRLMVFLKVCLSTLFASV